MVLFAAVSQKNPTQNTTRCLEIYHEKIITPIGINYIPLDSLKRIIRYYNYKTFPLRVVGSKSQRRKIRSHYRKNFGIYSYSTELDLMPHVCEIQYDKINVRKIKMKYERTKVMVEGQQIADMFVLCGLIFIMTFLFILMCKS